VSAGTGTAPGPAGTALRAALRAATAELAAAGVPSPRHDAEALAARVLGVPAGLLPLTDAGAEAMVAFERLVAERVRRVPLQYLTERAGFCRRDLAVGPGVFVPRPETELLADWAARAAAAAAGRPGGPTVVDLCAGSGAIALAVHDAVPGARVVAVEAEPDAYRWLLRNAAGSRVHCVLGDARCGPAGLAGRADVVVSNPPYLPAASRSRLPAEVAGHEPPAALWVEGDGLAVLRAVAANAAVLLRAGGAFGVEHADDQAEAVVAALRAAGFADVCDHRDLAGRPRYATGRRPGPP
jgi:release factor glutamine methyltransferase